MIKRSYMKVLLKYNSFKLVLAASFIIIIYRGLLKGKYQITKSNNIKYILQWTSLYSCPFCPMGNGQEVFLNNTCKFSNCFLTANRSLLGDIRLFDAILFNGPDIINEISLPKLRSVKQKYIFVSKESAHYYTVRVAKVKKFFNWTWTYKLNSDIPFHYTSVRNKNGEVIGPKQVMHWLNISDMLPVPTAIRDKLQYKNKAAAWLVSNCHSLSKREDYVDTLMTNLQLYNLTVDIFGKCGNYETCPKTKMRECLKMIETDYYFYLSFENSLSEDYVTEKILHALQNYAVPITFGAANYTRFMPEGIYLNAINLDAGKLADTMKYLIDNKEKYIDYFKWHNHYSFHSSEDSAETHPMCKFCEILNNETLMQKTTVYNNFQYWWTTNSKIVLYFTK